MYTVKLKNMQLKETSNGNDIIVKMVSLYKDWKFVRNLKITKELMDKIKNKTILVQNKENDTF
jgi:hypothetical protein